MSNRDLPGMYWQDRDAAGYGPGRRARSAGAQRDDRWAGNGRSGGYQNGRGGPAAAGRGSGNGRTGSRGSGSNGAPGQAQTWTGIVSGRARGSHAQRRPRDGGRDRMDWTGRFSRTADDLRNRLGLRSSSRNSNQAWTDGRSGNGYGSGRTAVRDRDEYLPPGQGTRLAGARTALRSRYGGGSGRGGGYGGGGYGRGGGRWDGRPPGRRGDQFQEWLRSGSWWRHWTVKKVLGLVGAGIASVILLVIGAFFVIYANTRVPTSADLTANLQSSIVYWANGQQMGHFDPNVNGITVDRLRLNANQIPTVMTQAMAAAEDRHFYTEGGVSVTGLARAAISDLFGSGNLQGGSTITMQYAKNYFQGVNSGQNLSTKVKEIVIAMKLGHSKSKQWVMTNYLNLVSFGGPSDTGLGAAALNDFNVNLTKPGTTLTPAQAAMLAAMVNSPGFFNPDPKGGGPGYTALVARWHSVLNNMVRDGNISQQVADAQKFPVLNPPKGGNGWTSYTGYLMSMVQQQLEAPTSVGGYGLSKRQLETGGYRITTTFKPGMMQSLYAAVKQETTAMAQSGQRLPNYDRIGAVLEDPKTGAIWAVYGGPGYGTKNCNLTNCQLNTAEAVEQVGSSFKTYVLSAAVNQGMNVFTSQLNGFSPIWIPQTPTGNTTQTQLQQTLSTIGDMQGCPRPPQAKMGTICFQNGIGWYRFDEPSENSNRPLAVNAAAAISSDPSFEDLIHRTSIDAVIQMADKFGVGQTPFVLPCPAIQMASPTQAQIVQYCNDLTGPGYTTTRKVNGKTVSVPQVGNGMEQNFAVNLPGVKNSAAAIAAGTPGSVQMSLGQSPLTPVEQASTFATLANDGVYNTPHVIAELQRQDGTTVPGHLKHNQRVLMASVAADIDYALSFDNVMPNATAVANVGDFRPGGVIGKTGTLGTGQVASQAWFIGGTPNQAALSVALFTNNPASQNLNNLPSVGGMPGSQGGGWPAKIWDEFMKMRYGNTPPDQMFPTSQVGFQTWNQAQARNRRCSSIQQFLQGLQGDQQQQCTCPRRSFFCTTNGGATNTGTTNGNPNPAPSVCFGRGCNNNSPPPGPSPTPLPTTTAALFYGVSPAGYGSPPSLAAMAVLLAEERARLTTAVT